jgi:biopolymer transport protein ExbD
MIDVVFVIMLFFMVMAGTVKLEKSHSTKLPGPPDPTAPMPDEIALRIDDEGQVYLNDDPEDAPAVKSLPELTDQLRKLKSSSDASHSDLLVTIYPNENAKYERVIDVLDSLSRAKIPNVTFQAGSPE